jgi:hypothetical protein
MVVRIETKVVTFCRFIGWSNKLGETIASLALDHAQTARDRGLLSARLRVSV